MSNKAVVTKPATTKLTIEGASTAQIATYPGLPAFVRGEGCWLFDASGQRHFDCTAGSGALNLGHNPPRVIAAATTQIQRLIHTGSMLHADIRDRLIDKLGACSPYSPCAVLLAVIGTEAIEAVLKVARAYTGRRAVIAFDYSYHGKSTGALSITWRERYRQFSPLPADTVYSTPYPVPHSPFPEDHAQSCLRALEATVQRLQAEGNPPAAVILEPAQCTEGILVPGPAFLNGVIKIAHDVGALVIFDEIYTGFGRCGTLFYGDRPGLKPDLMVIGKSLANGFPISAVLGEPDVINALPSGVHTSTFAGHPVACAVACEVIDLMNDSQPWRQAMVTGQQLTAFLQKLESSFSFIASARGEAMMLGFDCVNREGQPFPELTKTFAMVAMKKGLILHFGGFQDCTIKLTPPLTADEEAIEFLTETLFEVADEIEWELSR